MRTSVSILAIVLSILTVVPRVHAQTSHTASQSALDAALQQHVTAAASDREDLRRVLNHPDVKAVAEKAGLDLKRAQNAVETVDGQQLTELAAQARQVEGALAGGQSRVTISTTLIITSRVITAVVMCMSSVGGSPISATFRAPPFLGAGWASAGATGPPVRPVSSTRAQARRKPAAFLITGPPLGRSSVGPAPAARGMAPSLCRPPGGVNGRGGATGW